MPQTSSEVTAGAVETSAAGTDVPPRRGIPTWLPLLLLFAILARLTFRAAGPVDDPDTWWHLRLGEEFRGNWALGDPGQLSPFATKPWFATQWTLEIVASYIEQGLGLAGVAWLTGLGVLALGLVLFLACRAQATVLPAVLATGVALLGTSLSLGPRPQLASFILTGVALLAWLKTEGDSKPRWWLIPVTWVWACTHGMWFLSILVGLAVVVGLALDRRVSRPQLVRLFSIPVLSVVAAMVTPVGPRLILAPLTQSALAPFVTEWQPPDFRTPAVAATALMLATVAATWSRGTQPVPWTRILLLVMASGWTVLSFRTVALGAVIAAPLLASAMQSWLPQRDLESPTTGERRLLWAATAACVLALSIAVPRLSEAGDEVPRKLDPALATLPAGTVVFNDYALGGWLEWRHRNVAPVIDGMLDAYPVRYLTDYVETVQLGKGWPEFLEESEAEYALLAIDSPLALELEDHLDWREVAADNGAEYVLLQAPPE